MGNQYFKVSATTSASNVVIYNTDFTVSPVATEAKMTPVQAAKDIRVIVRNASERGQLIAGSNAKVQVDAALSYRYQIKESLDAIEEITTSPRIKEHLGKLRNARLNQESYMEAARKLDERRFGLTWQELQSLVSLVQHLPTADDLPAANKADSALRGIHALLKASGIDFAKTEVQP